MTVLIKHVEVIQPQNITRQANHTRRSENETLMYGYELFNFSGPPETRSELELRTIMGRTTLVMSEDSANSSIANEPEWIDCL